MGADRFGHQMGMPEAGRAAPPVERVRADLRRRRRRGARGPAAGRRRRSRRQRLRRPAITWTSVIGSGAAGQPPAAGVSDRGRGVEGRRRAEEPAQLVVGDGHGQGDRERPVVAGEHAVLEVAEVAADRGRSGRWRRRLAQPVEARQVDDAGVVDLLRHRRERRARSSHAGQRAAPAGGDHDERGREVGAARRAARRSRAHRRAGVRPPDGEQPPTAAPVRSSTPALGQHRPPQHPLEGGAPAGQHHQVLVAGLGRRSRPWSAGGAGRSASRWRRRRAGRRARRGSGRAAGCAGGRGRRGSADLGRAPAVPVEGLLGGRRQRRGVALEDGDRSALAGQAQRRAEPGDAAARPPPRPRSGRPPSLPPSPPPTAVDPRRPWGPVAR